MSGVSGVFPINLRFAFGNSFGSFLTKLSHMDPCLGMCFTSPTFVLHHCLYQTASTAPTTFASLENITLGQSVDKMRG